MTTFVLCGFSGAGKTTLLKRLEENSKGLVVIDLDQYIDKNLRPSWNDIREFIENKGIDAFRKEEERSLEEIFLTKSPCHRLISLGGGALSAKILVQLRDAKDSLLIWVDTPFEICWERIKNDTSRPLVKLGKEKMREIYDERCIYYQKASLHLDSELQNKIKNISDLIQCCMQRQKC